MFMPISIYNNKRFIIGAIILLFLAGTAVFINIKNPRKTVFQSKPLSRPEGGQNLNSYYPSRVFDLSNWKLTLPINSSEDSSAPRDVLQPQLATFEMSPWFTPTSDKKGIIFRAPVNAPTTANSDYPRSELREMTDSGSEEKFWPSTSGTHTLFLDQAITATPKNKPDVVAGQIHGDDDDLIVIRLEGKKLFAARSKQNLATLDDNYVLGKRFTVKFVARDGEIMLYYNGGTKPVYTLSKKVNEAYFKAGVYTQSNCETEDSSELCNADNYGEVVIYKAILSHE